MPIGRPYLKLILHGDNLSVSVINGEGAAELNYEDALSSTDRRLQGATLSIKKKTATVGR